MALRAACAKLLALLLVILIQKKCDLAEEQNISKTPSRINAIS